MTGPQLWTSWAAYPHVVSDLELINDAIDDLYDLADTLPVAPAPTGSDLTPLQTFLTANAGKHVRMPPNASYVINGSLTPGDGTRLDMQGSLITQTSASKIPVFDCDGTNGFTVANGRAQGNPAIYVEDSTVYPAAFIRSHNSAKNIRLIDSTVIGFAGPAVNALDTDGVHVVGCIIEGVGDTVTFVAGTSKDNAGVILDGATSSAIITGNEISKVAQGILGGTGVDSILIDGNSIHDVGGQHGIYLNQVVSGTISNNIVRTAAGGGIKVQTQSGAPDSTGVAVTGNTIDGVAASGVIYTCASNAVPSRHKRAVVTGNTISNALNDGIVLEYAEDAICTGNVIDTARAGIRITDVVGISVKSNRITTTSQDGILVQALSFNSSNVVIGQNDITNPGTANGAATEFGVRVAASGFTMTDVTIDGNQIVDYLGNAKYLIYVSVATQVTVTYRNNHGFGATDYGHRGPATACREWVGNNLAATLGRFHTMPSRESVGDPFLTAWSNAAPAAGTWVRGDRCWNDSAAASTTPGWVCVTSGTPGTWKAMAVLSA